MYSREKIDEVVASTDLVALIRQYVDLKRVGSSYKALCPFHAEKTPSFMVTPEKGVYHCFGCGAGGNAITFLMAASSMNFREALQELARRAGVNLPESKEYRNYTGPLVSKTTLLEVMKKACDYFQANLFEQGSSAARDYLKKRGLAADLARSYGVGVSLEGWDYLHNYLKKVGYSDEVQKQAGLIRARRNDDKNGYYDVFRNRLMIPICDPEGRPVALAGRTLETDPAPETAKYINSPATDIYKKGHMLYGFHQAKSYMKAAGMVFLVEGYFDLLSLVQHGVKNVVASMGTALTQNQINILRNQTKEVYLLFDGDSAGQTAASRALPALLTAELDGKVITLPKDHDPDTFILEYGDEGLFTAAENAVDILDYCADRLVSENGTTLAGQARAVREAKEMLARVPDAAKGQLLQRKLAEKLGLDPAVLTLGRTPEITSPVTVETRPRMPVSYEAGVMSLLNHVIIHSELVAKLDTLEDIWPQDASRSVFNQLLQQYRTHGQIEPEKIYFEESDELASLVSGAILTARAYSAEKAAVVFQELTDALRYKAAKTQRARLTEAISQAEQSGDRELMRKLAEEKMAQPHPMLMKYKPQ
ncbi:MAG: DNA primase [Deltaproteobacteria bacterium]|nr:DNA primase [Deltaproteobacteria bacterium]